MPLVDVFGEDDVTKLFSEESYVSAWLEVERALAWAQADLGIIPADAATEIENVAVPGAIDLGLLRERILVVGYPIVPLLEQIESASPSAARYIHWGATTQDIMDTGLALLVGRALDRIDVLVCELADEIALRAAEHRTTVMAGRTHAQPAVPITFGGKSAVWLAELTRHLTRLREARMRAVVVQLFGAAGTAAAFGPQSKALRRGVASRLGVGVVDVPWHTARDGLAEVGVVLASVAATCGKAAREVVELSRPELGEVREEGGRLRGASSTMPQKANPIGSEAVVGLSIVAGHQAGVLLAAMQGTHERAAGEWQAEWDTLPLVCAATAGAVGGARRVLAGLAVHPDRMRSNLFVEGGTIMAEAVMMEIAGTRGRAEAHHLVSEASVLARSDGISFRDALERSLPPQVLAELPPLEQLLDPGAYLGETDAIVAAAIGDWEAVRPTRGAPEAGRSRQ